MMFTQFSNIVIKRKLSENRDIYSNVNIYDSIVTYKYTAAMTLIKKNYKDFIKSILEKSKRYAAGKLELHVCPFLEYNGKYIYQPVFDFDKGVDKREILKFINRELLPYIPKHFINIEISVYGFHVVCYESYGLLTKEDIDVMREKCEDAYSKLYPHLDVVTSMRLMPIRRTPSIAKKDGEIYRLFPVDYNTFNKYSIKDLKELQKHKLTLSIDETERIIKTKILSKHVKSISNKKVPYFIDILH